jgi:glycosyltransferase involved in cell wall biosynthesis
MSNGQIPTRIGPPVRVSVVIPTKGRPGIVQRAVKSALGQTFRQLEVLVVVDGEDSETALALESLNDPRLRIVKLANSVGAAEARNVGVRMAHADWIAFLDDDDEWLAHKLERQFDCAIAAPALLPVVCSAYIGRSAEGDAPFGRRAPVPNEPVSDYMFCRRSLSYGENALATSVLFVPRELMLSVPFDPELRRHQDWDWALRALNTSGVSLYYIADPLSVYYMADGAARLSVHDEWQYSLCWCRERKEFFTPKAFSFFIVTECITRARQAKASFRDIWVLLVAYWREGQPTFKSALLGLGYLIIPRSLRRLMLRFRH